MKSKAPYEKRVELARQSIKRRRERERGTQLDGDSWHWKLTVIPRLNSKYGARAVQEALNTC